MFGTLRTLITGALSAAPRIVRRRRMPDPGSAAVVVLAVAESAVDANRHTFPVHDDNGVHAVGLAGAAVVLDGLAGPIRPPW